MVGSGVGSVVGSVVGRVVGSVVASVVASVARLSRKLFESHDRRRCVTRLCSHGITLMATLSWKAELLGWVAKCERGVKVEVGGVVWCVRKA